MGNRIVIFHGCSAAGQPREVPETRDPRTGSRWVDGDLKAWTNWDGTSSTLLFDHGKQTEFLSTKIDRSEDVYVFIPHDGTAFDEARHVFIETPGKSLDQFKRAMCPQAKAPEPPPSAPGALTIPGLEFTVHGLALRMEKNETKKVFTPHELLLTTPDGTTVRYQGGSITVLRQERRFAIGFKGFWRVSDDPDVAAYPKQLPDLLIATSLDARGPEITQLAITDDFLLGPIVHYLAEEAKLPPASIRRLIDLAQQYEKPIAEMLMTACIAYLRNTVVGPEPWKRWFGDAREGSTLSQHLLRHGVIYPPLQDLLDNATTQISVNPYRLEAAIKTLLLVAPDLDRATDERTRFGVYLDYLHKTRPQLNAQRLIAIAEEHHKDPVALLQAACFNVIRETAIAQYPELAKTGLFNGVADYAALQDVFKTKITNPKVIEVLVLQRLSQLSEHAPEPNDPPDPPASRPDPERPAEAPATDTPKSTGLADAFATDHILEQDRFARIIAAPTAFPFGDQEAVACFVKTAGARRPLLKALLLESARALQTTPGKMRYVAILVEQGIAGDGARKAFLSDLQDAGGDVGRAQFGRIDFIDFYLDARPVHGRLKREFKGAIGVILVPRPAWQKSQNARSLYEAAIEKLGSYPEEGYEVRPQ
ncbi:MAG: hypothetical protein HY696_03435 [Deltaproteobacteria bacterium]|nr:hypothetical protein [Deltaproteobacteria bacterium]